MPLPLRDSFLQILDEIGYGGILLDARGSIIQVNSLASRIIGARAQSSRLPHAAPSIERDLRSLLSEARGGQFAAAPDSWAVIDGPVSSRRPVVVRWMTLAKTEESAPHAAILLIDLNLIPKPAEHVLMRVFSLTPFEARLAIEIAAGKSPDEIAAMRGTKIGTVRTQLASVYEKTDTHRQSELVALLAHLAILR